MSRGPGKIERAILALMQEQPDHAWTTEDLAENIYAGANKIEKKHRVSILRAMQSVTKNDPDWFLWRSEIRGGTIVLMNYASVRSYGLARLKTDFVFYYRGKDPRTPKHFIGSEADMTECLNDCSHKDAKGHLVVPGGHWWRHVQQHIAERDGNDERAAELKAENEMAMAPLKALLAGG